MKNVKVGLITTALVAAFVFGACGGDGDVVKKYSKLTDEMCKCEDAACAKKVVESSKALKSGDEPSKAEMKKLKPMMAKFSKCMRAAMTAKTGDKDVKTVKTVTAKTFGPAEIAELIKKASIANADSTEIFAKVGPKAIPTLVAEWTKRCTKLGATGWARKPSKEQMIAGGDLASISKALMAVGDEGKAALRKIVGDTPSGLEGNIPTLSKHCAKKK